MMMAAWAMLMRRITPKIKVSPLAIRAYIPPTRTPRPIMIQLKSDLAFRALSQSSGSLNKVLKPAT